MQGENYKDVIVSQPPAMYGNSHNISLENFKGILLCEKPTAEGLAAPVDSKAFVPSNRTGNPLGYGPTDESRKLREKNQITRADNSKLHRNQNRQYLSRHKKWLYSFTKAMRKMRDDEIEHEVEMARRAARFRQGEGQKREEKLMSKVPQPDPYNVQEIQTQLSKSTDKNNKNNNKAGAPRPKWAMTEEEALMADEAEAESLLDFAKKLDYDKFITDYTIAEALNVMRDRVEEIARANNWSAEDIQRAEGEEDDDEDLRSTGRAERFLPSVQRGATPPGARRAIPGAAAAHDKDWDGTTSRRQMLRQAISKDALALADRILENTPSMLKVHTRQSLARVLQKCVMSGEADMNEALRKNSDLAYMATSELAAATAIGPPILQEPTTVKVSAESTALEEPQGRRVLVELQNSKEKTQNLPYLYRCPAI